LEAIRGRNGRYKLAYWGLYIAASWAVLYPILITAIVADDYLNPFYLFDRVKFSPTEIVRYSWDGSHQAGHFNYLGTFVGNSLITCQMFLMSIGIRYSVIYAVTKLVVFVSAALAASAFARLALDAVGRPQGAWRVRVIVSTFLFGTLQLHIAWSNDPVGSYPLAGFASVALGFVALTFGLKAVLDRGSVWIAVLLGIAAMLYYELNAATIVALVPLVVWAVFHERGFRFPSVRTVARYLPLLAAPGMVAIVLQLVAAPQSAAYTGTAINASSSKLLGTFWEGIVGGLPGASWALTRKWIQRPIALQVRPVLIFVIVATAVLLVVTSRAEPSPDATPSSRRKRRAIVPAVVPAVVVVLVPVVYWLASTFLQTSTQKVQDETHGIGYVYNFYAVSVTCVAVILAIGVQLIPWARVPRLVSHGLLVTVFMGFLLQMLFNWNMLIWFNNATLPNQALLVAFSDQETTSSRCTALVNWTGGAWPDYYEIGMVDGVQHAYRYFHGVDFCPGFVDTTLTGR
jgi:hypothetical protein